MHSPIVDQLLDISGHPLRYLLGHVIALWRTPRLALGIRHVSLVKVVERVDHFELGLVVLLDIQIV